MGEVLVKLLNMSIAASWLILAVCLLRVLMKRAPRWIICALWGLVAFRLICPVAIESEISLIPSIEPIQMEQAQSVVIPSGTSGKDASIGTTDGQQAVNVTIPQGQSGNTFSKSEIRADGAKQTFTEWDVAGSVWLIGAGVILAIALIHFIKLKRSLREAVPLRENIWICDAVTSPFILGIGKPRIYLSSSMDEAQMESVIAHENAHIRRFDPLWKLLGYLLLAVYWFNPLSWLAYHFLCKDIELACDEKVVRTLPLQKRQEYCQALLACSTQKHMRLSYPLAFGEVGVKERVKKVLHYRKPQLWVILVAVVVCAVVCVCFLTNPKEQPKESTEGYNLEDASEAVQREYEAAKQAITEQEQKVSGKYTDDELKLLAGFYYRIHSGTDYQPSVIDVDSENGDSVLLHLYDNMEDHSTTLAWYEIDRKTGKGQETVTFQDVDLTEVLFFLDLAKSNENFEIPCLYADEDYFIFSVGTTEGSMGVFSGKYYVYNRSRAQIEAEADLTDISQFEVIGQYIYYQKYRVIQSSYGDGLYRTDFSLTEEEAISPWLEIIWYDREHDVIFAAKQSEVADYRRQLVVINPDGSEDAVLFDPADISGWEYEDYDKIQYLELTYDGSTACVTVQHLGYREGISIGWRDAVLDEERFALPYRKQ